MPEPLTTPLSFANTPDSFDIHRDCRALFLDRVSEILKGATSLSRLALEAYRAGAGEHYDAMVAKTRKAGFEQANGLTASRITLVGDDDLEIEIRLSDMTRRLNEASGNDLWRTYLRYQTLLRRPELEKTDNPVGPEAICAGLTRMCSELGAGLDQTLDVLDKVEDHLLEHLPALYRDLNQLLEARKVEAMAAQVNASPLPPQPAQNRVPQAPASAGAPSPQAHDSGALLASLHQMLLARQPAGGNMSAGFMPGAPMLPDAGAPAVADPALTLALVNQLIDRLNTLENQSAIMPDLFPGESGGANPGVIKQSSLATRAVRAKDVGLQDTSQAAAIDAVGLVFEAIFDHPTLPSAVKMTVGSLQVPMLKAAIQDSSFFGNNQHPIRRLLDHMARATVGLPRNVGPDHPLCQQLHKIAQAVRTVSPSDPEQLAPFAAQIDELIAGRVASARAQGEAYLPLAENIDGELAATALARTTVQAGLGTNTPAGIDDFLRTHWLKVLHNVASQDGEDSEAWRTLSSVPADLQWSVQPKINPDDRKRLLSLVPGLLLRINKGLDRIAIDPLVRNHFLDLCFNLQTAALKGRQIEAHGSASAEPPGEDPGALAARLWTTEQHQILSITQNQDPCQADTSEGPDLTEGWIDVALPGDESLCGFLSWISPRTGAWLLTNPDEKRAAYVSRAMINRLWLTGQLKPAASDSLFDCAAEQALQHIR